MWNFVVRRDPLKRPRAVVRLSKDDPEDMRRKADRRLQSDYKRKSEVENWLAEVEKMKDKKQEMEGQVKGGESSSHSYSLKKQVVEFTSKCTDHLQPNYLPDELTLCDPKLVTTPMKGGLFKKNLEQVLSWLDGDGATSIGVYGMGGVGKTTLAQHVQNKLCQRFNNGKCSGYVYWVTVSHGVTLSSLQSKIAKQMGLENQLNGQDEEVSAAIIKEALKRRGNCVLILDDVWERVPAEEIGIPIGEGGFKLLVTARSKDVCNQMNCEKSIKVKCLSDDESWDLFKEKLGESTILSEEVEAKARQVAKECKGLPIAIITIASSMRRVTSTEEWRNVLKQLQQLTTRQQEVVEVKVLPSLQLSYDQLGSSQLQDCFLSCAFYPEDHSIRVEEELIACWTREGLLQEIESREDRRDEGHSIVNRLVNASLLEYKDDKDGVKMHDLVREMAVKVCRGKHFLIRAGEEMEDIPPEDTQEVEDIARMVAKECKGLPIAIVTIASSMRGEDSIREWRNVLKQLQQLTTRQQEVVEEKVLPELQFSYDRLGDPQLQDCFLCCAFYPKDYNFDIEEELIACWTREGLLEGIESREERRDKGDSIVNRLVNACLLEYNNDKDGVKMHDLVREMAVKVCRGKHFLIRAGEEMEDIPPEEKWTVDLCKVSLMSNDIKSISPAEPPNCPNLKTLLLGWNRGLKSISSNFFSHLTSLRVLDLRGTGIASLPESISDLVNLTHLLLSHSRNLTHLPSLSKLQKLRELDLRESGIESLPESISDLVNLTYLLLFHSRNLTHLPSLSKLQKLRALDLRESGIKSLPESISDLVNLTHLLLEGCQSLTHLPSLSKLQKLTKLDLSRSGIKSLPESISDLVNLTDLLLEDCTSLTDLPSLSKLHKLTKLDLRRSGIKSLPESISDLVNLTELLLDDCKGLTHLPSLSKLHKLTKLYLRGLRNLKSIRSGLALRYLRICNCEALEEVIGGSDNDVVDQPRYLSKLEKLWLVHLPNLKSIRSGGLSNIWKLEVKTCHGLKWLFTLTMACNLQNLSSLLISECDSLEEVIGGPDNDVVDQPRYLPKLENLELEYLPNLKRICRVGNVGCNSIDFYVSGCPKLETEDEEEEEQKQTKKEKRKQETKKNRNRMKAVIPLISLFQVALSWKQETKKKREQKQTKKEKSSSTFSGNDKLGNADALCISIKADPM